MNYIDQVINLKVRVTNLLDQNVTGSIYAFSPAQKVLVLKTAQKGAASETFRVINTKFVKSIHVFTPQKRFKDDFRPTKVDVSELEHRINSSIKAVSETKAEGKSIENDKRKPKSPEPAGETKAPHHGESKTSHSETKAPVKGTGANGAKNANTNWQGQAIFKKLAAYFGPANVARHGHDSILLFGSVLLTRPYALNKVASFRGTASKAVIDDVKKGLRQIWLQEGTPKKGG